MQRCHADMLCSCVEREDVLLLWHYRVHGAGDYQRESWPWQGERRENYLTNLTKEFHISNRNEEKRDGDIHFLGN